ncbi:MAG: winged helix DNA-binding domain-containing protein [Thermoleophilaceae bacterium]
MGCLQAQYAPSMYIGLWSRIEGLERDEVTRALERKSAVQGTLMRSTIHLVSKADYWPLAIAVRETRREHWKRTRKDHSARAVAAAAKRLRSRFAEGPLSRAELSDALDKDPVMVNAVGLWLDLVRVPPSGTWERRRADLYATAEDWLGPPPGKLSPEQALDRLVRRYLTGFGPASLAQIANWAGLHPKRVAPALERIRLRRFVNEGGDELVDLPGAPLPDPETPAPVRFLPTWDATLLVHARATGVLPEEHRPRVFNTKTPQSMPTFLVDGEVAGSWRYEKGRIGIEPFGKLTKTARRELDAEAERLAAFHG